MAICQDGWCWATHLRRAQSWTRLLVSAWIWHEKRCLTLHRSSPVLSLSKSAPRSGNEVSLQLTATPSVKIELASRVRTFAGGISIARRAPRSHASLIVSCQRTCRAMLPARSAAMRAPSKSGRAALLLRYRMCGALTLTSRRHRQARLQARRGGRNATAPLHRDARSVARRVRWRVPRDDSSRHRCPPRPSAFPH